MSNDVLLRLLLIFSATLIISGCEDLPPEIYEPEVYVEAYLIVDEPIKNIVIMTSQPLNESFSYEEALVRNAYVKISDEFNNEYVLQFRDSIDIGYFLPDTTIMILPETEYNLEIIMPDSSIITASTRTPPRFGWINPVADTLHYPQDTLNLPAIDSLIFSWEQIAGAGWYLLRVRCLDTLEYGSYLNDVDDKELNRRIMRPWSKRERFYNDVSRWVGPIPNSESPIVWNTLKWFGKNEISIYAPDINFLKWFIHFQRTGVYEPLLSSVNGALGVFGSASAIRKNVFVIKNQP